MKGGGQMLSARFEPRFLKWLHAKAEAEGRTVGKQIVAYVEQAVGGRPWE